MYHVLTPIPQNHIAFGVIIMIATNDIRGYHWVPSLSMIRWILDSDTQQSLAIISDETENAKIKQIIKINH